MLDPVTQYATDVVEGRKAKQREYNRAYRLAHLDALRAANRAYGAANRAKISASKRAYYIANRVNRIKYIKSWRAANPDKVRGYYQKWAAENPEKARASEQAYREANRDKVRAASRAWWARQQSASARALWRPRRTAIQGKRIAAKRQAMPSWADRDAIDAIYREAARITRETGIPHDVDHIYPLQGRTVCGLHVAWNLQVLPRTENQRKHNKHPERMRA